MFSSKIYYLSNAIWWYSACNFSTFVFLEEKAEFRRLRIFPFGNDTTLVPPAGGEPLILPCILQGYEYDNQNKQGV
jgi:hypothetical protein